MSKSLLKTDKRELAFDWIAKSISAGALNCSLIIIKIHTICQNPANQDNLKKLIKEWLNHIFSAEFQSTFEEWTSEIIVSPESRFKIENIFFNYLSSYMPIFFLNKKFKISRFKTYKWTKQDFEDLKNKTLENWFSEQYNNSVENGVEDLKFVEFRVKKVINNINAVAKENSRWFPRSGQMEFLLSLGAREYELNELLPEFEHSYQKDLFEIYSKEFLNHLPNELLNLESRFYESGNYLHSFFNWND